MTDNDTIQELQHRVEQLEEQQEQLVQGAIDAQGRNWSVSDFLNLGLNRRQALTAVAAIASGATIGGALREAVGVAAAAASSSDSDGDVGTPSNRVDVFADGVDTTSLTVGPLTWEEDPNSPVTVSGGSSGSISLASTDYDIIHVYVNNVGSAATVDMQVNGDTGTNYDYVTEDGTTVSNASAWEAVTKTDIAGGQMIALTGKGSDAGLGFHTNQMNKFASKYTTFGSNLNVSPPLTSITWKSSSSFSATFRVFGGTLP